MLAAPYGSLFIVEIRNQIVGTALVPDQAVHVADLVDKCRSDLPPRSTLVTDNALNLLACK
jgi:hypothetical protein